MENRSRKKDIAIIGVSGRYPKSANIQEFWQNLVNEKELVHSFTNEELLANGAELNSLNNENLVKAQALLDDPFSFDYRFFGYTKQEALCMDPQIRLMHQLTWLSLEDAGYNPKKTRNVGLYLAASDNINWKAYTLLSGNENVNTFYRNQVSDKNFISTLISYNFNFNGPSYYVDTACSSSLVAVHMACRALLMRECSMALAGGVRVYSKPYKGHIYQEGMTNSKDGKCRPFDKESNGIVSGEGAGVVVLKRLEEAIKDRDHIYAVIRSSAVNNDGNRKVGYTAPSVKGQSDCIKQTHAIAGIQSSSISYVEAHGTATKLGDPIEVEALNKAFNYDTNHTCKLGSVKSNIGHLDAAAGITGLIKTTLALKNKTIPATLYFSAPNPEINFESGPFKVQSETTKWAPENEEGILRAGVSSFGIGGNNAHVILEEAPNENIQGDNDPYYLISFSAQSSKSLYNYQKSLVNYVNTNKNVPLKDIAYTLHRGRNQFKYNRFLTVKSHEELVDKLMNANAEGVYAMKYALKDKIVFMCTGSGTQYINMGKELYAVYPEFKKYVDKGLFYLKELTNINFSEIVYSENSTFDPKGKINQNEFTQPIVFVFEYALAKLLMSLGIQPDYLIGHSTGEFVAASLSGVFSYEGALSLIVKRAQLMSQTEEGAMLSIHLTEEQIVPYLNDKISLALVNSKDTCVVSGTVEAIDDLLVRLKNEGVDCKKLKVSLGAHSFLMDPILEEFRSEVEKLTLSNPNIPFISNLSGEFITEAEAKSSDYWVNHLRNTVRFSEGITTLMELDNTLFLEIGPGNALTTLCREQCNEKKGNVIMNLIRHPKEEISDQQYLLQRLGEIYNCGIAIQWENYYKYTKPCRTSLPGYVFEKTKLESKIDLFGTLKQASSLENINLVPLDIKENDEDISESDVVFEDRLDPSINYLAPSNKIEEELVVIWEEFFGVEKIGVLDSFFALGGNSLKAVTMIKIIQNTFNIEIKIKDFFNNSNIKNLSHEIELGIKLVNIQKEQLGNNVIKI